VHEFADCCPPGPVEARHRKIIMSPIRIAVEVPLFAALAARTVVGLPVEP
jgi:hypothetical protein